jgi:nucleoside 2-deoxyribosyltransferase
MEYKQKGHILYLSGPITGNKDYVRDFGTAAYALKTQGYKVINPASMDNVLPEGTDYETYMKIDLQLLDMATVLVQLPGWEKSLGCNREYGYALAAGKMIIQYENLVGENNGKEKD